MRNGIEEDKDGGISFWFLQSAIEDTSCGVSNTLISDGTSYEFQLFSMQEGY